MALLIVSSTLPESVNLQLETIFHGVPDFSFEDLFFLGAIKDQKTFRKRLGELLNAANLMKLAASVKELEHSAGLLELNFNPDASLEHFLLRSLQIWAR